MLSTRDPVGREPKLPGSLLSGSFSRRGQLNTQIKWKQTARNVTKGKTKRGPETDSKMKMSCRLIRGGLSEKLSFNLRFEG